MHRPIRTEQVAARWLCAFAPQLTLETTVALSYKDWSGVEEEVALVVWVSLNSRTD